MAQRCPKCHCLYGNGKRQKTVHHILPRRLWKNRDLPDVSRQVWEEYTLEICRGCHDELNALIDDAERELLYMDHQRMYAKILTDFLKKGGGHAISPGNPSNGNGLLSAKATAGTA